MRSYFEYHLFDEWIDIENDINNGFRNCCCKEIIFEQFNIINMTEKQNQYLRLKNCISTSFYYQDLIEIFSILFNENVAKNEILPLFNNVLIEQGFKEKEEIRDDIEDFDISVIFLYIVTNTNYNKIKMYHKQKTINLIYNGLKYVVLNNKTSSMTK